MAHFLARTHVFSNKSTHERSVKIGGGADFRVRVSLRHTLENTVVGSSHFFSVFCFGALLVTISWRCQRQINSNFLVVITRPI